MKKILFALATVFSLSSFAANKNLPVDTANSKLNWKATKKIGSYHTGTIGIKSGEVTINKKKQIVGGKIIVDMKSIKVTDIPESDANNAKLVGHLNSADFFDTSKNAEATLSIKKVTAKSAGQVDITADLTIKNKTHPVTFPATVSEANGMMNAKGKAIIDRTLYDVKYGSDSFFKSLTADKIINNTFEIDFDISAKI